MQASSITGRFVEPAKVITHLHLRPGDRVADFGTGAGYFIRELSAAVGDEGYVYACEIQKQLIEAVGDLIRQHGLENVQVLWCDLEMPGGTKLQPESLDAGLLVNVLFQLEDKDAALAEISRTVRSGGKLFVIDWSESFGGLGPQAAQVVPAAEATALGEAHGFILEREFDAGDHHYGLAFKKA